VKSVLQTRREAARELETVAAPADWLARMTATLEAK
jgi:hypothetical protein